ncbi:polysaccharide deacetylase family sporulation protein PdaB [Oceanobacillus massiliensis]|uniref:polysaccharide deacetylase family sporulation protein PdaB n=1 Tax=Oceanobacillus massiliensis TaxID=1465765 RepID=UPI0002893872|nr:polysaccharide deacetylase family sporulation protein PdaB [Oceanobacillus massiliensis]
MDHFYVIGRKRIKGWLIISLALISALLFWSQKEMVFSVFSNETPVALSKGNADEPNIALTFNISWGEERALDILKKLEEEEVQATFFVSGEWAERHPDILQKISDGKHELGMLGYRYKSYLDQEIDQVRKDLLYARDVFEKLGYEDVELLRTPSGHFNKEIIELAESLEFKVIHWNINPNDWKNPGTSEIIDTVMKNTTNGDILLLHASDAAKQTADALSTILPGLVNKGFQLVTISELMNQAHAETKIVE